MIRNLMPHPAVLAPSDDPATWVAFEPRYKRDAAGQVVLDATGAPVADPARVAMTPGVRATVEGCPVPVVSPTVFGRLDGLPESVEPGELLLVSLVCASAAAEEADEIESTLQDARGIGGSAVYSDEGIATAEARLIVLQAVVSPGQGRDIIPWTAADRDAGLCPPTLVGLTRAVRALVRAVR